ncbi:carbohydrate-binding module family 5 protein [Cylindrobasidium torrendii FP15055 ss-10]|uniref:chitinase n=1 Tax=Cylindrobasidium torrendii FP15055 ss-10 TaxID=1314674 RepID=A0A0D7BKA3_9AGAR|nr:carbohydrate-binding module family 5 protein [Cylindrobasidium torrendii FP15055 ss-10]
MAFNKLSLLLFAATAIATQVMHRPDAFNATANEFKIESNPQYKTVTRRAATNGKLSMAYFTNWGIYSAYNYQPADIPVNTVTHVLYSFMDVSADTGAIALSDSYADLEKHYDGDSWNDTGNNVYGCIKQMYLLKLANRGLKVLFSVGGWNYSQANHFDFVTDAAKRATFVSNAVSFIENYGFDGIDIDFEYPHDSAHGQGFADLISELRTALDNLASSKGDTTPYILSAAVSAGAENYASLVIPQMDKGLDFWNLMAYDYAGSWLTYADHQANLYGGERTGVSTDAAIKHYTSSGATKSKITMGIPLYGRAFEETDGIGSSFNGVGPGSVEAGTYNYNALPLAGATVYENSTVVASYSYDSAKRELVSYDTPSIVKTKVAYINDQGLAGSMFWSLATDKTGDESLIKVSANVLGSLDSTENHINYPNSQYDNIKNNMGQGGSGGGGSGGGDTGCGGVAAWSASAVFTGGQQASYNGYLWTAKWWTQGETPGSSDVWQQGAAC